MDNTTPKELTKKEIQEIQQKLAKVDQTELNKIFISYKQIITSLITLVKEQAKQNNDEDDIVVLEQLARIVSLAPLDEIFIRSHDEIWDYKEQILTKDSDFFLNKNYSLVIKKDKNQQFLETLIAIIKTNFPILDKKEQNFYWVKVASLLNAVIKYKKLTADFL